MRKAKMSIPPFILAFILGPILERNTRTALLLSNDSPVAATLIVLAALSLAWSLWRKAKQNEKSGGLAVVPDELKH